jgi:hypothetical protein
MLFAAASDDWPDAGLADLLAVLVVVVAAVGVERARTPPGTAAATADGRYGLGQRHECGDVVAVAAGQRHLQGGRRALR